MIYKTYHIDIINEDQRLYLNKKISWNKWRTNEPYDDVIKVEKPSLLKQVYWMIVNNDVLSQNTLNNTFKLPKDELEKMIEDHIFLDKTNVVSLPKLRIIK